MTKSQPPRRPSPNLLILPQGDEDRWLATTLTDDDDIQAVLVPFPADRMTSWRVGKAVNSVRNNAPGLSATETSA